MATHDTQFGAFLGSQSNIHTLIKASRLLDHNLPDILSRAPMAANCMGMLRILALSRGATLAKPIVPGKHVTHDNLPANLEALVLKGMDVFDQAQRGMTTIQISGNAHFGPGSTVSRIINYLTNEKKAKAMLGSNIDALRMAVERCAKVSSDLVSDFDDWKLMAGELSELIAGQIGQVEKQKQTEQTKETDTKIWERFHKNQRFVAEKEKKKYQERLEQAVKEYKKESERQTSVKRNLGKIIACESLNVGFAAVNGLINLVTTVPDVVQEGFKAVGNLGALGQGGNPYASGRNQSLQPKVSADQPTTSNPPSSDAAFMEANRVLTAVRDFEQTCRLDFSPSEKMSNRALFQDAVDKIQRLREEIKMHNTPGSIHICTSILDPIVAIGKDAVKAFHDGLANDAYNVAVNGWIARCEDPRNSAIAYKARADSQPGQAFGATMPSLWPNPANSRSGIVNTQQLLERKAQQMLTVKLAMEAAKRDYDNEASRVAETEEKLTKLTSLLTQLASSQDTLAGVNKFLRQAIRAISELQSEVRQLVSYFHGIHETIGVIVIAGCQNYLALAQKIGSEFDDKELRQLCAEDLFQALIGLRGNFAIVYANACFYQEVSTKFIMPAINEVCRLPIDGDENEQIKAQKKLEAGTKKAAKEIKKLGRDQRAKLVASLDSGIAAIENEARRNPVLQGIMNQQRKVIQGTITEAEHERGQAFQRMFDAKTKILDNDISEL
ncbi:hypothetical protein F4679DRAFT_353211 [Xylaria curta]|nr:hypothetical protein F4679DRAFT_353211 [Xylaria curta]